jgi:phospholipase/carboxylesterase
LRDNHHQNQRVVTRGRPLAEASSAMILVHGRGATAESILELASLLPHPGMAYLAPQAAHNSWYPYSFMYPTEQNEPYLTSALARLGELVAEVEAAGIPAEKLVLAGFSQGACLAAEFAASNARRYGGLLLFSGGLIGPPGTPRDYDGSLDGTPVFIGCSDSDFHIPLERVQETTAALRQLGAAVTEKIYPGMGHTIVADEIEQARRLLRAVDSKE